MAARRSFLTRLISWLIALPVLVACVLFALDNRGTLVLGFWPAPWKASLPIYVAILGAIVAGFLFGGIVAWLSGHRKRAALHRARLEADRLRDEVAELQRRLSAAEAAQRPTAATDAFAADRARRQLVVANS